MTAKQSSRRKPRTVWDDFRDRVMRQWDASFSVDEFGTDEYANIADYMLGEDYRLSMESMPARSNCGRDCLRAIKAYEAVMRECRNAHGDDAAMLGPAMEECAGVVCVYING